MTGFELKTVEAAATALFPKNAHPELTVGAEDLDVRGYFSALLERSSFRVGLALRAAIWFCAFGPIFVLGKWRTLGSLDLDDRQKTVDGLIASPIYVVRQLVLLMKVHVAMIFGGHPVARAVMMPPLEAPQPKLVTSLVKGESHVEHVA